MKLGARELKIAHLRHAGLYPDDTINGSSLIVSEVTGPDGELVSVNRTTDTLAALRAVGVIIVVV